MRKSLMVAGATTLVFGAAGLAHAQTPPPGVTVTTSVSPSKAGTKARPKAEKLKLSVKNDPASKTTAAKITITFPSTLKTSTKGLPRCTKSDEDIVQQGPKAVCRAAIAGTGTANALINPFAPTPAPVHFKVTPMVGKNELLFYLDAGALTKAVLHGKISGKKLTIAITPELQQPVSGTFSALIDLSTTMSKKKGRNSLFTSTGCKSKQHKIGVSVGFVPNPTPPASATVSGTGVAKCS